MDDCIYYSEKLKQILEELETKMTTYLPKLSYREVCICISALCNTCEKDFFVLKQPDFLHYIDTMLSNGLNFKNMDHKFFMLSAFAGMLRKNFEDFHLNPEEVPNITWRYFKQYVKEKHPTLTEDFFFEKKMGELTVFAKTNDFSPRGYRYWIAKCSCGQSREVDEYDIILHRYLSCGDRERHSLKTDLRGKIFGFLKVADELPQKRNRRMYWKCTCGLCGNIIYRETSALTRKIPSSYACGCLRGRTKDYVEELLENKEEYIIYW